MLIITLLTALGMGMPGAFADDVAEIRRCDDMYAQRTNLAKAQDAGDCYRQLAAKAKKGGNAKLRREALDWQFMSLFWVITKFQNQPAERPAIDEGMAVSGAMVNEFPTLGFGYYWRGVFVSHDAMEKDRGSSTPTNLFKVLGQLETDFREAIKLEPSVHVYGPQRALGAMHTQMPPLVGGDKRLAERLLKAAYDKGKKFSQNHIFYAKILIARDKNEEAKKVLNNLLAMKDGELNPYEPHRIPAIETAEDRVEARKLLESRH
ncbi:MAG: hypothetical protein A2583_14880 [Bdellovibrionales bacterium RIFOXYD1_FULL_53_11]|nr:MAG: hypothetical protein A2583_14880 [Bdellovibrionales bacterium RIFOXYD1_FULL_53_11]